MVPSTRVVPPPRIWRGSGTQPASTWPMTGRSRSHRRDTMACEQPKMSPATSWVMFARIKVTTIATDLYRPITAGPPPGLTTSPMAAAARAANSVSCPWRSPVIASRRNGFSLGYPACDSTGFKREAVLISSLTRRQMLKENLLSAAASGYGFRALDGMTTREPLQRLVAGLGRSAAELLALIILS